MQLGLASPAGNEPLGNLVHGEESMPTALFRTRKRRETSPSPARSALKVPAPIRAHNWIGPWGMGREPGPHLQKDAFRWGALRLRDGRGAVRKGWPERGKCREGSHPDQLQPRQSRSTPCGSKADGWELRR